jgi:hypothetical protein
LVFIVISKVFWGKWADFKVLLFLYHSVAIMKGGREEKRKPLNKGKSIKKSLVKSIEE